MQPTLLYRRVRYGYSFYRMPLSQGQYAIVDADDYPRLSRHKWYAVKGSKTFYAVRGIVDGHGKRLQFKMHREVLKVPDNMLVDHVNRNGLDNRKANLRPATHTQNMCNRGRSARKRGSKYKGVHWNKSMKKWRVRIGVNRTRLRIGEFSNEIEAAKAYDRAARKHHKEFAVLNFPESASL
jgi:hypothetical protein